MAAVDPVLVQRALDEVRPFLTQDGGGVELVGVEGDVVTVRLVGSCAECSLRQVTLKAGVESVVKARVPAVAAVVAT